MVRRYRPGMAAEDDAQQAILARITELAPDAPASNLHHLAEAYALVVRPDRSSSGAAAMTKSS